MSGARIVRRRARAARGYTLVELMMALALFSVAILGIISMQKITVASNAHAKNLATAQRIAQAWAGQLEMDATQWRTGAPGGFLNGAGIWQRPTYDGTRLFGAAFDVLGNPLDDNSLDRARFCTHLRLSWMYRDQVGATGNGMLRAEIRVFWQKEGETTLGSTASMCGTQTTQQATNIGLATDLYHFVYQTVGVRQHFQI
ncbi:MAG TPA: prepilin-type N-terminal cleavage/methylation domain-containing protein [Polyangiaceae bacterium]|nr:prepilin-type N-terminal cleavage/methylation domain-containing protein [Polyangiaceae bacterium]